MRELLVATALTFCIRARLYRLRKNELSFGV
jgi:hypothetical protein